jgi:hypothetical protein
VKIYVKYGEKVSWIAKSMENMEKRQVK